MKSNWPLIAGGAVLLILLGWIIGRSIKKSREEKKVDEAKGRVGEAQSPEQLASLLYAAMFDNDWFGFSENEELIMEVGAEIGKRRNWPDVVRAYGVLYKHWWSGRPRNLEEDLRSSLTTEEYQRFLRIVSA